MVIAFALDRVHEQQAVVDLELVPARSDHTVDGSASPTGRPAPVESSSLPAAGVERQLDFVASGDGVCSAMKRSPVPKVSFDIAPIVEDPQRGRREVFAGEELVVCLNGFKARKSIGITLVGPDKKRHEGTVKGPRRGVAVEYWSWNPLPGDRLGRHLVKAQQGSRTASNAFKLSPSPTGGVRLRSIGNDPRPEALQLIVVGAPNETEAHVHVYRAIEPESVIWPYFTTVSVPVDQHGAGVALLVPDDGSRTTCYGIEPGFPGEAFDTRNHRCLGGQR